MAKKKAADKPKPYRILSLDGGGIRGLITARWLEALEEETKKPITDYFDLIAGTSTGSALACAIACGLPAKEIVEMYLQKGKIIFAKSGWIKWFQRVAAEGIDGPKYDGEGLEKCLKEQFGDATLASMKHNVLVTSYDTQSRVPVIFKNWRNRYKDLPVWEVVKASCSAPTYFPGHGMRLGRADVPLVDGGVVANNPAACALAEGVAMKSGKNEVADLTQFKMLSLGTGELTRPITLEDTQEWGKLEWVLPIIDVLFDGAGDAVDYQCKQMLGDNYLRVQCQLTDGYDEMDNADQTNLNALLRTADDTLNNKGMLQEMKKFLSA